MTEKNLNISVKIEICTKCRVCLKEGNIPIYDADPKLCENVCVFGDIEISENDLYPKHLCHSCFNALQMAVNFRHMARETDMSLRNESSTIFLDMPDEINNDIESVSPKNGHVNKNPQMDLKKENEKISETCTTQKVHETKSENTIVKNDILTSTPSQVKEQNQLTSDAAKYTRSSLHYSTQFKPMKNNKFVQCVTCSKIISLGSRKEHYTLHKSSTTRKGSSCENSSSAQIDFNKSSQCDSSFQCNLCDKKFKYEANLHGHMFVHKVKKQSYNEPIPPCYKYFEAKDDVHNKDMVQCLLCNKIMKKSSRQMHYESLHTQISLSKYLCEFCGKGFQKKTPYVCHKSTHLNEFPFKCQECPYKGRNSRLLRMHMRVHSQKIFYTCGICSKQCKYRSNFMTHMRRHNAPKYKCSACNKGFFEERILNQHYKTMHLGMVQTISCQLCDKVFTNRKSLLKHQNKIHDRKTYTSGKVAHYKAAELQENK